MLISAIAGFITGYIVSIPPLGPISFALISKGFKNEVKDGLSIASGAALMDFIYCMIAFGGVTLIISLLPDVIGKFYHENVRTIQIVLTYTGCALVVIYGLRIMRAKVSYTDMESKQAEKVQLVGEKAKAVEGRAVGFAAQHHVPVVKETNWGGLFLMGVLLCLSSITLPASWLAFVSYLKGYRIIENSILSGIAFSAGAFFGTLTWFYTLLKLITGNKNRIKPDTVNKLNVSAGVILILLGIFLFAKATLSIIN